MMFGGVVFHNEIAMEKVKNKAGLKSKSESMTTWKNTSNDLIRCPKCGFVFKAVFKDSIMQNMCICNSGCTLVKCRDVKKNSKIISIKFPVVILTPINI